MLLFIGLDIIPIAKTGGLQSLLVGFPVLTICCIQKCMDGVLILLLSDIVLLFILIFIFLIIHQTLKDTDEEKDVRYEHDQKMYENALCFREQMDALLCRLNKLEIAFGTHVETISS